MKRALPLVLVSLTIGYLVGYSTNPRAALAAQAPSTAAIPGQAAGPTETRAMYGKGVYYSADDIKKWFPPADKAGNFTADPKPARTNHLAWDPSYRFTVMRRQYFDPPRKSEASGEMLPYVGSEMHENKTQIYVMSGGSGAVVLGGKPKTERPGPYPDGQHSSGMLVGGTAYRVKPGDVVVIPPGTWHMAQPDPGQTLTYGMCHIEDRTLMP